jgi:transcriptional regulator GlxA family with amidase domain
MAFLRDIRLQGVRRDLSASDPEKTNLADLALRWGFFHYGRFAHYYRERYGERPQDTLKCIRGTPVATVGAGLIMPPTFRLKETHTGNGR